MPGTSAKQKRTPGSTPALTAQPNSLMSILRRGKQNAVWTILGDSTGNETTEWVYLTALALAARFPAYTISYYLFNDTNQTYDAPVTMQTGTGGVTLTIYNCSVPGMNADYVTAPYPRLTAALPVAPTLITWSYSYNIPSATDYRPYLAPAFRLVSSQFPGAEHIFVSQAPEATSNTDAGNHFQRTASVRAFALARGCQVIDAMQAFLDYGDYSTDLIQGDFKHPNAAGSQVWAAEAIRVLTDSPSRIPVPVGAPSPSTFWVPATQFAISAGSPDMSWNATLGAHQWNLDAALIEEVATTANPPAEWGATIARAFWYSASGTGNVKLTPRFGALSNFSGDRTGTSIVPAAVSGQFTQPIGAGSVQSVVVYAGTTTDTVTGRVQLGRPLTMRLAREGSDAADTYASDLGFLGVLFTRAG